MTDAMQKGRTRSHARATGVVYLSYFVVAILGMIMVSRKFPGGTFLTGFAPVLYVTLTVLLYRLFRRVHPLLALAAVIFGLAGGVNDVLHQLHLGVANLSSLVFFGPFCILLGVLILQSRFLPRWLGWPLIAAGLGWLAYLIPAIAQHLKVVIFPIGFLAEFELMLWLLIRGVDEERWSASQS
jgi:hypothetical protein